jgi:phospholipid/cholesterol/gamma-HCH transport system substrate-binding protein
MNENDKKATDEELPEPPRPRGYDRELWVGLFVVLAIGAVVVALFTLTDAAMFRGRYIVKTVVPDASGIRRGDPVQMRGVNIGRVHKFKIVPQAVEIQLEIEGEYPVPSDSTLVIKSGSLLGGLIAEIVPGNSETKLANGDTIQGRTEGGLMDTANTIAESTQQVVERMKKALSDKTVQNIEHTADVVEKSSLDARALMQELRGMAGEQRKEIRALTESLRRSATSLESATTGPQLKSAVDRLDSVSKRLDEASASFNRSSGSLETILTRIEHGEGTLGRLTKDDVLYVNLNEATQNLNRLLEDLRRNPKRYVNLSLF